MIPIEPLRAGDPLAFGRLYDEHAARLYTYCRAMVGEEADAALRDAFAAAPRAAVPGADGPRLWLYRLVRAECLRRSPPPVPDASPLGRAAARLRREHREVLVLAASLETADVARVLGVATDTAEMLLDMARRRLAQAATAVLGAGAAGRLHELVTRPYEPPKRLRDQVLVACAAAGRAAAGALLFDDSGMPIAPETLFGPAEAATVRPPRRERRRPDRAGGPGPSAVALGLAMAAAVAVGVLVLWPGGTGDGKTSKVDRTGRIERSPARRSPTLGGSLRSVPRPLAPRTPAAHRRGSAPASSRTGPPAWAKTPHSPHPHPSPHGPKPRG